MSEAAILRILGLIDTAFVLWEELGQDKQDLLQLRADMEGMDHDQKISYLQARSASLQERADELRDR